jgi:hypothetical protein
VVGVVLLALGPGKVLDEAQGQPESATPTAPGTTTPTPTPMFSLAAPADPDALSVPGASFSGWTLLDRATGKTTGSANADRGRSTVESMIKPWLAADWLRRAAENGETPSSDTLDELTLMIVDSNDPIAESYYQQGGADAVVERLIDRCGLSDVVIEPDLWGMTLMTPLDAARYGACLADGRAAGPQWTPWVLDAMRNVRGGVDQQDSGEVQGGRWGIVDGLPPELAKDTSFKNGWTLYEDGWHVNCLAVNPAWVLAVMMRIPDDLPVAAEGCATLASKLVVDHA